MPTTRDDGAKKEVSKAPKKRGPVSKYNWDRAEQMFVEGYDDGSGVVRYPTVAELAVELGYNEKSVYNRSSYRRWHDLRKIHQLKLAKERHQKRSEKLAQESIAFDERALDAAKMGLSLVTIRLGEIAQKASEQAAVVEEAKERLRLGLPVAKEDLRSPIWSKEIVELATAAQTFQAIGMRAMGTDVQKIEVGGNLDVQHSVSVVAEMQRDDPERVAAVAKAMMDAGLMLEALRDEDDRNTIDGEVLDEDE